MLLRSFIINVAGIVIKIESEIDLYIEDRIDAFIDEVAKEYDYKCTISMLDNDCQSLLTDKLKSMKLEYANEFGKSYSNEKGEGISVYYMNRNGQAKMISIFENKNNMLYADEKYKQMFEQEGKFFKYLGMDRMLLEHNGFYFHSSLLNYNGDGILFSGDSGVGKSTQADLWEKNKYAKVLNGDRSIIRITTEGAKAYGSPFAGSSNIFVNGSVAIKAIIFLEHGEKCIINKIGKEEAFRRVFLQAMINNQNEKYVDAQIKMIEKLVQRVDIYHLKCTPDIHAVNVLEEKLYSHL